MNSNRATDATSGPGRWVKITAVWNPAADGGERSG